MMSFSMMQRIPRIKMKLQDPIDIFGKWAEEGKDLGMEKGHANSVKAMLEFACKERADLKQKFSFLDARDINPYDLMKANHILLTHSAVPVLKEVLNVK